MIGLAKTNLKPSVTHIICVCIVLIKILVYFRSETEELKSKQLLRIYRIM